MKIKNIELYENGNKWVIAWKDNSSYYPEKSEAFFSKAQAEEFKNKLIENKE